MSALIPALIECFATGNCGLLSRGGRGGGGGSPKAPKPPPDPTAAWEKAAERSFNNQFDNQLRLDGGGRGGNDGDDELRSAISRYSSLLQQLSKPVE